MNQALLLCQGKVEGSAWGMKAGTEQRKDWGNEGKARRLRQHSAAGRPLVLHHSSLTITDMCRQRVSLDKQHRMLRYINPWYFTKWRDPNHPIHPDGADQQPINQPWLPGLKRINAVTDQSHESTIQAGIHSDVVLALTATTQLKHNYWLYTEQQVVITFVGIYWLVCSQHLVFRVYLNWWFLWVINDYNRVIIKYFHLLL